MPPAVILTADTARSAPAAPSAPSSAPAAVGTRPGVRNRTVLLYLALTAIALVPGLLGAAKIEIGAGTAVGDGLATFRANLEDIKFGSGLRFWLGVGGATMMGLMLLYPLRKLIAGRRLGAIGAWFHIHILFGLGGPVLILYHCNFGLGSFDANVALWSMLVIAGSGVVGQFVYMRVNAGYFGERQTARKQLDVAIAKLRALGGPRPAIETMIRQLDIFHDDMLTPRQAQWSRREVRRKVKKAQREAIDDIQGLAATTSADTGLSFGRLGREKKDALRALDRYFGTVRSASGRAILEQLWARWRLFHLPVFLVMSVAVVVHVAAVWNMDGPAASAPPVIVRAAAPATRPPAARTAPDQRGNTEQLSKTARGAIPTTAAKPASPAAAAARPVNPAATSRPPTGALDDIARLLRQSDPKEQRKVAGALTEPAVSSAQSVSTPPQPRPLDKPREVPLAQRPVQAVPPVTPLAAPMPIAAKPTVANIGPPKPVPQAEVTPPPVNTVPPPDTKDVFAELESRIDSNPPPMNLGAKRTKSLAERIADLKEQNFNHATTRFPLTGKHAKADCESCHVKTLENNPRECVACHKKDDVHRGRRTECGQCHTTVSFSGPKKR